MAEGHFRKFWSDLRFLPTRTRTQDFQNPRTRSLYPSRRVDFLSGQRYVSGDQQDLRVNEPDEKR